MILPREAGEGDREAVEGAAARSYAGRSLLQPSERPVRLRWQFDPDGVPGANFAAPKDHAHDTAFARDIAFRIAANSADINPV